jgi:hypothetical protein
VYLRASGLRGWASHGRLNASRREDWFIFLNAGEKNCFLRGRTGSCLHARSLAARVKSSPFPNRIRHALPDHSQRMQNQDITGSQQAGGKNNRVRIAHAEIRGDAPGFMLRSSTAVWTCIFRAPPRSLLPCNLSCVWHRIPLRSSATSSVRNPPNKIFAFEMSERQRSETENAVLRRSIFQYCGGSKP